MSRNLIQSLFTFKLTIVFVLAIVPFYGTVLIYGAVANEPANEPSVKRIAIEQSSSLSKESDSISLVGSDARTQLLVQAFDAEEKSRDITRHVVWRSEPAGILAIDPLGYVTPLRDGVAMAIAESNSEQRAGIRIEVSQFNSNPLVNFPNQVVPIFTKLGCNSGGCHGKAAGQNGFRLSLLGFEPREDYGHLLKESRGRRLAPASPDASLLLSKATNEVPHGGGQRLEKNSQEYRILQRWISQGSPYGVEDEARVVELRISPPKRRILRGGSQQLMAQAVFSNGRIEDVTRTVQFDTNDPDMAEVDRDGFVTVKQLAGTAAIMGRYQGQVATFVASIPLAESAGDFPEPYNEIDVAVMSQLKSLGIPVSEICDDSTFLRRVTLDIAGRLPKIAEIEAFVSDNDINKRSATIERLLGRGEYADFFANKWVSILRNRRDKPSYRAGTFAFHRWIQTQFAENRPYDEFVRSIVAATGSMESHPPTSWYRSVSDTNSRVEDTAQLFLGQRIQCARCHHHPHEKWSQRDYYKLSAFFTTVRSKPSGVPDQPVFFTSMGAPRANHPKTGESLAPAALDAANATFEDSHDPRQSLVDWMIEPNNPFFAKSLANRYWKHFLGRGLVEPEDDLRVTNPASNPELLDVLAQHFVASKFDLKELIRFICNSRTYQTSSEPFGSNLADRKCYSRFYPKRLSAEVLVDAMDCVVQSKTGFDLVPEDTSAVALPDNAFASYFLTAFGKPDASTACECERSSESTLAQCLHLVNSKEMQTKLGGESARAMRLASDTGIDTPIAIRELFLIALSRQPSTAELESANVYIAIATDRRAGFEDLLWALINGKEFQFNH